MTTNDKNDQQKTADAQKTQDDVATKKTAPVKSQETIHYVPGYGNVMAKNAVDAVKKAKKIKGDE